MSSQRIKCYCGGFIRFDGYYRHTLTKKHKLSDGDEDKRIYVEFLDSNGNEWVEFAISKSYIDTYFKEH